MGFLMVIFGGLVIIGAALGKEFHAADPETLSAFERKVPTWLGRLVFAVVGISLMGFGFKLLLGV